MWLKAKADDFFRSRDYRSALNAYGEAISLATDDQNDLLVTYVAHLVCKERSLMFDML